MDLEPTSYFFRQILCSQNAQLLSQHRGYFNSVIVEILVKVVGEGMEVLDDRERKTSSAWAYFNDV